MVINPPIVCQTCQTIVQGWKSSKGDVICPDCGNIIYHRDYLPCPQCNEMDYYSLIIVNNNNWHYDSVTNEVTDYNDKKGVMFNICGKRLEKDINEQNIQLMSAKVSQDIKRKIYWTSIDDYDPTKPMPQYIIDKFPYDKQD